MRIFKGFGLGCLRGVSKGCNWIVGGEISDCSCLGWGNVGNWFRKCLGCWSVLLILEFGGIIGVVID